MTRGRFALCMAICVAFALFGAGVARAEDGARALLDRIGADSFDEASAAAGDEALGRTLLLRLIGGGAEWDLASARDALITAAREGASNLRALFLSLLLPGFVWALLRLLSSQSADAAGRVCYCAAALTLTALLSALAGTARDAIARVAALTDALFPPLAAALAAFGAGTSAALLSPIAAYAGGALMPRVFRASIWFCSACAALSVADGLGQGVRLGRLISLARSAYNWMAGTSMAALLGALTVQGMLGASYDGAAIRSAKYAVDNLLPVIGGDVADTLDMVVASATLVKNAMGVTGLALLLRACARPAVELVVAIACCRVAAALIEPVGAGAIEEMIGRFASVMTMLLIAVVLAAVTLMALIAAFVLVGGAFLGAR